MEAKVEIKQVLKQEQNDKKNNYCGECHCSCTCNADCGGDVTKCTSEKSIKKGCNHCCGCYLGLLAMRDHAIRS